MVRLKLGLWLEEVIWESFINKLDTKRSNLPLDNTRVFTFSLNLHLDYKSIPSLYAIHLAPLFLGFLGPLGFLRPYIVIHHNFLLLFYSTAPIYNAELQLLFIGFYSTTPIWTMRWSWPLDGWRILINPIRSWSPWSRKILNPSIETNFHWIESESYLNSAKKGNL